MVGKRALRSLAAFLLAAGVAMAVVAACPARAHAINPFGEIWVGGVRVTADNYNSIEGIYIKGKVSFSPATCVLTLENATITGPDAYWNDSNISQQNAGIFVGGGTNPLTICLVGRNVVYSGDDGVNDMAAIYANCDLSITGDGRLTAYGRTKDETRGRSCYGVCVKSHTLSIDGTNVGLYADETPYELSYGAYAKSLYINYSNVDAIAYSWSHNIYDDRGKLVGRNSTADGIGLYGAIAINYSNVFAAGGRYAIGRTPKCRNVTCSASAIVGGEASEFAICDYKEYKAFFTTPVESYDLCVGGIWVTESNKDNILSSQITGKASFNPDKQLLTLRCAYISGDNHYGIAPGIYSGLPDLKINLVGNSSVVSGDFGGDGLAAIVADDLTLFGKGTLTARGMPRRERYTRESYGIVCNEFTMADGGVIALGKTNAIVSDVLPYYEAAKVSIYFDGAERRKLTGPEYDASTRYQYHLWDTVKYFSLSVNGSTPTDIPHTGDAAPLALLCGLVALSGGALWRRARRRRSANR